MRKIMTFVAIFVIVVSGFLAMGTPVAAKSHGEIDWFWTSANSACGSFENDAVPVNTMVGWMFRVYIENPFSEDMTNVVVKERFAKELMVCTGCPDIPDPYASQGIMELTMKGKTNWFWLEWDVGTIPSGGYAVLILVMATDMNPKGHQEFTETGDYELNNGAILRYDMGGFKWRETSESTWITVV
jgi:hypothetical protein